MKLDVFVDVTEAEDWMAVAGQIGDTFPRSNPSPFRPQIVIEDRGIDIERHFLIFSLDGASTLTSEQKEFFKTHPYLIRFFDMRESAIDARLLFLPE